MKKVYVLEVFYECFRCEGLGSFYNRAVDGVFATRELAESRDDYILKTGFHGGRLVTTHIREVILCESEYWLF